MDKLEITGLKVNARIGVHEWEQAIEQTLLIDVSIPLKIENHNDDLNNTLDYDALCQFIQHLIQQDSFRLIETVAETIAQRVKETYAVAQIMVRVSKPGAIKNATNVSITIER